MYALKDTFNNRIISRHRTLDAVARAQRAHAAAVRRHNGATCYIPYSVLDACGVAITDQHAEWADWTRADDRASARGRA